MNALEIGKLIFKPKALTWISVIITVLIAGVYAGIYITNRIRTEQDKSNNIVNALTDFRKDIKYLVNKTDNLTESLDSIQVQLDRYGKISENTQEVTSRLIMKSNQSNEEVRILLKKLYDTNRINYLQRYNTYTDSTFFIIPNLYLTSNANIITETQSN